MKHRGSFVFLVAAVAVLALVAGVARGAQTTSTERSIAVDGLMRTFLIYRPPNLPSGMHPPLVVVLHGYGSDATAVESRYHWDEQADARGFVVAYPNGTNHGWNSGNCCAEAQRDKIDDVKFLTNMVQAVEASDGIDSHRVYFTGMSNGAHMAYRMACDAAIPIAAIGPVSGTLDTQCSEPQPTSVLAINGRDDLIVPFKGGKSADPSTVPAPVQAWRVHLPAIETVMERWRAIDRCGPSRTTRLGAVTTEIAQCPKARTVESIAIDGAGHQWPGAVPYDQQTIELFRQHGLPVDQPSMALDATRTLWEFFAAKEAP
ncbi:MAG: polyhydroxybutyrate depolymerase [Candidatus Eremiobacteraeota bacterium]|nr:polyhydroxybutyrate depolymerase [Candidatus Eremiobacteraeota bacterium]MBV8356278.1 polyhydroxybutyrate depolymerase [Candidatus Eremiobacteraeota bacterium]